MDRTTLMQQIALLDKQINEESAKNRMPSLSGRDVTFPFGSWIGAASLIAVGLFGGMAHQELHTQYGKYVLILGGIGVLFSFWRTLMFFIKGKGRVGSGYAQSMEKVRGLQLQRQELQKRLNELNKT